MGGESGYFSRGRKGSLLDLTDFHTLPSLSLVHSLGPRCQILTLQELKASQQDCRAAHFFFFFFFFLCVCRSHIPALTKYLSSPTKTKLAPNPRNAGVEL